MGHRTKSEEDSMCRSRQSVICLRQDDEALSILRQLVSEGTISAAQLAS